MPYQAAKTDNDKQVFDQQTETDEQAVENTVQGAGLLLSLTKGSITNAMVTPQDPAGNNTSTGSLESSTNSCDSGMGPPIAAAGVFQRNNHQPRMLYHSPIKISSSSTSTSKENLHRSCDGDGISSDLAPYTMVPAWSPSLYNGMVYPTYGRSPIYNYQQNKGPDEKTNGKRSLHEIEEKKELDDGTLSTRKQRLISPSSSNEKTEEESPSDSISSDKKTTWTMHGPQRPVMYSMPPHWQHSPGYPPPPHLAYPHYPMYSAYPPPWGMYGPPPNHPPNILPPPGSFRRHQSPKASTACENVLTKDGKARNVSNESLRKNSDEHESTPSCPRSNESLNRCIQLKQPIPKRSWTSSSIDRKLPDFSLLVNFPDHLSKGRNLESSSLVSSDGTKPCVMCGQLRLCSASISSSSGGRRPRTTLVPSHEDPANAGNERTAHIIPRQNKGVCTVCDVAVWLVRDHDNLEIKWCKGCKNFRPWAAFGDKGLATKCVRCRKRQKEKYATQKISGQNAYDPNGSAVHRSENEAVSGLHQLMKSSPM